MCWLRVAESETWWGPMPNSGLAAVQVAAAHLKLVALQYTFPPSSYFSELIKRGRLHQRRNGFMPYMPGLPGQQG